MFKKGFKWIVRLLIFLGLISLIGFYLSPYKYKTPLYRWYYSVDDYHLLLKEIEQEQQSLKDAYRKAPTPIAKKRVIKQAEQKFESYFTRVLKYWYGTPWSYEGTTEVPGKGSIACGYFVTTVLRDMGYPINRIRMAQAASEKMIVQTVGKKATQKMIGVETNVFLDQMSDSDNGVYLLGLDTHTGFIWVKDGFVSFVHSSRSFPKGVRNQAAVLSGVLQRSNYKVVGKLPIEKWIE